MMEVKIRRIVVVEVVVRVVIIRYNKIINKISRIMQNNLFLIEQMENFKCLWHDIVKNKDKNLH